MTRFETSHLTEAYRTRGEDRVAVIHEDQRTVIVVADGAGGTGSSDLAAETVVREVQNDYRDLATAGDWTTELWEIDRRIGAGESTAVVVDLRPDSIIGASVGDSRAWIVDDGNLVDLSASQNRKPLLGSRNAVPVGFSHSALRGVLLVATDGFCNYVKRAELAPMIATADFFTIPRRCVEMVRLPSGDLWDDLGIVACRVRRIRRPRKRYAL